MLSFPKNRKKEIENQTKPFSEFHNFLEEEEEEEEEKRGRKEGGGEVVVGGEEGREDLY